MGQGVLEGIFDITRRRPFVDELACLQPTQQTIDLIGRHLNDLTQHISVYNPQAQQTLHNLQGMFRSRGSDPVIATKQSYQVVWGMVQQQAAMLAYMKT